MPAPLTFQRLRFLEAQVALQPLARWRQRDSTLCTALQAQVAMPPLPACPRGQPMQA